MNNIFKLVFVIIGTLIGAGFASGQEVYLFFLSYGKNGIIGMLISSAILGLIVYKSFVIINKYNTRTYKDFLNVFFKAKEKQGYFNFKTIINIIINLFILVTFFIMIAGFGAYFEQQLGIKSTIGSIILAILCFCIFMTSEKGVVKANELIVPIIIIFIGVIGIINLKEMDIFNIKNYIPMQSKSNYIISSILYGSYNSILLIPVLITLKDYIKSKKQIAAISIITTIVIGILGIIIFLLLVRVDVDITKLEMPAVYVVSKMSKVFEIIYGFIILSSIFTTSISLGTSFLKNVTKNKKSYTQIALIMCITSVIISKFGFSNLINYLYPFFGILGLVQILALIFKSA